MIRKLIVSGMIVVVLAGLLTLLALRDNPAATPSGDSIRLQKGSETLAVYRNGPEGGPTIVLVASFARSVADFDALAEALAAAGYHTLRVEARGVGGSTLPDNRPLLFDYADDLAFVLDRLEQDQPVALVGHAFGNRVARAFAARYPERVSQLVLLAAGDSAPPPETRNAIFTVMCSLFPLAWREPALRQAFFAPGNEPPPSWLSGWYPRAGLAQAHATANTPKSEWVTAGNTAPITVVQPAHDAAAAQGAAVLQDLIPSRVTVVDLPEAGHAILPEQPLRISEIVLAALQQGGEV